MSNDTTTAEAQARSKAHEVLAESKAIELCGILPDAHTMACQRVTALVAAHERTLAEAQERATGAENDLRRWLAESQEEHVRLTAELVEVRRLSEVRISVLSEAADTACALEVERDGLSARLAAAQSYGAAVVGVCARRDKHRECCPSHYNDTGVVLDALAVSEETVTDLRASLASMTVERDEAVAKLEAKS